MKLLATKIVAKRRCGFSSNLEVILKAFEFDSSSVSISACVNENRATSDPDMSAEHINKIKSKTKLKILNN